MVISNKEEEYINNLVIKNEVSTLKTFFKDNKFELNDLNNDDFNLLITSIQQNGSVKLFKVIIEECQYQTFSYSTSIYDSPLYYAIFYEKFQIADILLKNNANINYVSDNLSENILYHLYHHQNLSIKKLEYLLKNGAEYTVSLIEEFINKYDNIFLKILLEYTFSYQKLILKLLNFSRRHLALSTSNLESQILNEFNGASNIITKNLYQIAVNSDNYEAIKLLYDYDIRDQEVILNDIFEIFDEEDRLTRNGKKFNFVNLVESGILHMDIDFHFLNNLENIDEKRAILTEIVLCNSFSEFKQYLKDHQLPISYYNTENMDMAILAIENNISLPMFDYICRHYRNLNYCIDDILIYRSPLSTALAQNKFQMADILIRYGADIGYKIEGKDIYEYLNDYQILNPQNLKYLLKKCSYVKDITSNYISELLVQNNSQFLEIIFKHYIFNESCILNFLTLYKNKTPVSREHFNHIINKKKEKINFEDSFYEDAVSNENYRLIDILYHHDTRSKQTILNDIFYAFQSDKQESESSEKTDTFIEKIRNKEICGSIDEMFIDNLKNFDSKRNVVDKMISNHQIYELKIYLQENDLSPNYFQYDGNDLLNQAIDENGPLNYITFLISKYEHINYTVNDYISPLYTALSNNNFKMADILLKSDADINYQLDDNDIIYTLNMNEKLNLKNLHYILDHGFVLSDSIITNYIGDIPITLFRAIFMQHIYQGSESIIHLLNFSKNRTPLRRDQFNHLLKDNADPELDWDFYDTALDVRCSDSLMLFLKYDIRSLQEILSKYSNGLFKTGIVDGNTKLIDKVLSCPEYDYCGNLDFERIIISDRNVSHKKNIRTLKYFFKRLFQLDQFDLARVNLVQLIEAIQDFGSKDVFKYIINKICSHSSFTSKTLSTENIFHALLAINSSNIYFVDYFLKKCIRKKMICLNFDETNFNTYLECLVQSTSENDVTVKFLLDKCIRNSSFNFSRNANFLKCIITMKEECTMDNKDEIIEYFIEKACAHPTFDFTEVPLHKILNIYADGEMDNEYNTPEHFHRIIDIVYANKNYQYQPSDLVNTLNILHDNDEEDVYKYLIDQTLSHISNKQLKREDWMNYIQQLSESGYEEAYEYFLEKSPIQEEFEFNFFPLEVNSKE